MEETHLDENIVNESEHTYAGFWVRTFAALIDGLVLFPLSALYMLILVGINSLALTMLGLIAAMIYKPYMEYRYGATLGKMALGIRVVKVSGGNPSMGELFLRWSFRLIDIFLSVGSIAALSASSSDKTQRLGDVIANTCVIKLKPSTNTV